MEYCAPIKNNKLLILTPLDEPEQCYTAKKPRHRTVGPFGFYLRGPKCFYLYEVLEWSKLIYDHGNQKVLASRSRETEIDWKGA